MKRILALSLAVTILMSCFVISAEAAATVDKPAGEISAESGQFTITLDSNATEETLNNISFKKKDGDSLVDIKGGAFLEIDEKDSKKVILKYGVLEKGNDYVLDVLGTQYEYNVGDIFFKEDFEGYSAGDKLKTRPEMTAKPTLDAPMVYYPSNNVPSGKANASVDTHSVGETEDGDNFVRLDLKDVKSGYRGSIVLETPEPIDAENFYMDIKVRVTGEHGWRYFLVTNFSNKIDKERRLLVDVSEGKIADFETTGENGFFDLRMVMSRDEEGYYTQTIRNLNDDTETAVVQKTKDANEKIYSFWLSSFVCVPASTISAPIDISEIVMDFIHDTDVLHIDEIGNFDEEITVVFTDEVKASSLSKVTMTDKNGEAVEIQYDEDKSDIENRTAVFKLGEILDCGADYTLSFAGVEDSYGRALKTESVGVKTKPHKYSMTPIAISPVLENNEIGSNKQVTISTEITAEAGKKFTLLVAVFDSENRLIKAVDDTKTVEEGQTKVNLSKKTPDEIDISDGCTVRTYVWEDNATDGNTFISVPEALK